MNMITKIGKLTFLVLTLLTIRPVFADVILGAPIAQTGPVESFVARMQQSLDSAVSDINIQGGVLGQPLKIIYADTLCDADVGVEHVTALVNNPNVTALLGPVCSGVTLRTAQSVSIPAGVVALSFASASSLITDLNDNDYIFRTAVSDAYKGAALARLARSHGVENIAVSFASDAYNTGAARAFSEAFESLGGNIVMSQIHEPNAPSYVRNAQVLARRTDNVAIFSYYGAGGLTLLTDILETNDFTAIYGADGMVSAQVLTTLQDATFDNAHFVSAAFDKTRTAYQMWLATIETTAVDHDALYVASSYDAVYLIALAIEAIGSTDRALIRHGLRAVSGPEGTTIYPGEFSKARELLNRGIQINYEGASGRVDFDAAGDVIGPIHSNMATTDGWSVSIVE
jgi:branched-chain amino acid transport system substrate-binding protein